jgi:hypothetical protein
MKQTKPVMEEFVEILSEGSYCFRKKTIDYQVARGNDEKALRTSVHALLERGYRPCGGIAFRGDDVLFQAMFMESIE